MLPEREHSVETDPLRGKTVLIVDDESLVCFIFGETFIRESEKRGLGMEILAAGSVPDALEIVKSGRQINLVVTDYLMNGQNGRELIEDIKNLSSEDKFSFLSSTIFIMVSATFGEEKADRQARELGAHAGFAKPVAPIEIVNKARELFKKTSPTTAV